MRAVMAGALARVVELGDAMKAVRTASGQITATASALERREERDDPEW